MNVRKMKSKTEVLHVSLLTIGNIISSCHAAL